MRVKTAICFVCLSAASLALVAEAAAMTETPVASERVSQTSLSAEDTFILDKSGNAFEMDKKLAKLVAQYKTT
jgi:hypothetical protein